MTVKNWRSFGLAISVCFALSPLARAADGQLDRATLRQMGLGSLVVMSDEEALSVRGQGYKHSSSSAMAFGNSSASFDAANGGAHSENGYLASGKHKAAGGNYSEAGVSISVSKGNSGGGHGHKNGGGYGGTKTTTVTLKYFAGGSSWAKAY